jgi:2-amino-4-hydroxy-6-hydroxymethyldihydropteridine diphosphokinase
VSVVYIGIGSNLGDRAGNCLEAVAQMEASGVRVTKRSALLETEPWGVRNQPLFINMVVEGETGLTPSGLLALLKGIEHRMGRGPSRRWGPRILVVSGPDLVIPHPSMHERSFVLGPLSEIAGDKIHPVLRKTIRDLADAANRSSDHASD